MLKVFSKALVATFILIAFIGQVFAYATMSCEMSSDSHIQIVHSEMNHSDRMIHSEIKTTQTEDCCSVDCVCPASACTSANVLNSNNELLTIRLLSEFMSTPYSKQTSSIFTSLYRPPIFA